MAINPTRPVNPAPYQAIHRVASSRDLRISRRAAGEAAPVRTPRSAGKTEMPTVGQQIDKILSKAEKALFSLLFSESETEQTAAPSQAAPAAEARPRPRTGGRTLGRAIDIRG